jgi:hypothetical protein
MNEACSLCCLCSSMTYSCYLPYPSHILSSLSSSVKVKHSIGRAVPRKDLTRETRDGWPLLTLKLRQMEIQGVHKKGVLPWLVRGLVVPVQDIFVLPWLVYSGTSTKYFFLSCTLFHFNCPHRPEKVGSQSCQVACLLICVLG